MNNLIRYSWQRAYQCAVLETDSAQMARRIDDALRAIEQRVGSTVRIDITESDAIESARNALAKARVKERVVSLLATSFTTR
jgi:low affinity Fe/Cu permease